MKTLNAVQLHYSYIYWHTSEIMQNDNNFSYNLIKTESESRERRDIDI